MSVAIWMGAYEDGGYAWNEDPDKQFHYHPTLMAVGLIFLQGEAMSATVFNLCTVFF
jgi:cytochrome b-561